MGSEMIKIADAAKLVGVSAQTVRQWILTEKIRGEKKTVAGIKKAWYVYKDEVLALVGKA